MNNLFLLWVCDIILVYRFIFCGTNSDSYKCYMNLCEYKYIDEKFSIDEKIWMDEKFSLTLNRIRSVNCNLIYS